jgi:hypothetical protein
VLESAPSLRVDPMPPRITQKSHRPRASHRMMVGTLSQRLACAASPRMVSGPLHETTQGRPATAIHICRTVSALGVKPKILSTKKKGLDASNDRGLTERSGEVFSLDILSHRMSENQVSVPSVPGFSTLRPQGTLWKTVMLSGAEKRSDSRRSRSIPTLSRPPGQ